MIKINLQTAGVKKAKKRAAPEPDAGGGGGGGVGPGRAVALMLLVLPIGGGLGGSFYLHAQITGELDYVAARTREAEAEIARLKPVLDELTQYKKDKEQLERKLGAIRQLEGARRGPVKVLAEMAALMPPQVWVTAIREANGVASLEGVGLDSQSVAVFVNAMHRSPYFRSVELTSVEQTPYLSLKVKKFTMTCQFVLNPAAQGGPAAPGLVPASAPAPGQ
jgi:hypothetical protein